MSKEGKPKRDVNDLTTEEIGMFGKYRYSFFKVLKEFSGRKSNNDYNFKDYKLPVSKVITIETLKHLGWDGEDIDKLITSKLLEEVKSHTEEELLRFDDITKKLEERYKPKEKLNLFLENKEEIAEEFYKVKPYFYDDLGLFWFWEEKNLRYILKDKIDLMVELKEIAKNKNISIIGQKFWTETIRALQLIGRSNIPEPFNKECIQFGSEVCNYKTKENFKATPKYFNVNPIPWSMGKNKETPNIDRIFEEWVDKKYVKSLKETIALATIQDYPLHRIIILYGSGLNGKGEFLRFLNKFFGSYNVCSTTLKRLIKGNFESAKLYKKQVCIMGETDFSILTDTTTIKQLTGQDLIPAEIKGSKLFDFTNYALMFMGSNSLPMTLDKTKGFYRRPYVLDFPHNFKEGIDVLKQIPEEEYNNFCNQVLELLPELIERGRFDKDGGIEERKGRYEERSNPLGLFIQEKCILDVNGKIPFFEFFDDFNIFCNDGGYRELNRINVSSQLEGLGYETEKQNVTKDDGSQTRWTFIIGLRYRDTTEKQNKLTKQYPKYPKYPIVKSNTIHGILTSHKGIKGITGINPIVEEVIDDPLKFETKFIMLQKCSVVGCDNCEVNPDSKGKLFCKDHWEALATK